MKKNQTEIPGTIIAWAEGGIGRIHGFDPGTQELVAIIGEIRSDRYSEYFGLHHAKLAHDDHQEGAWFPSTEAAKAWCEGKLARLALSKGKTR